MIFKHCLVCDTIISHKEVLCNDCINRLEKARLDKSFTLCKKCGYPLINEVYSCPECNTRNGNYIVSLYDYRDSFAREILESYKFKYRICFSKLYARILIPYVCNYDVIIPVPSSESSLKKRGWDQMKQICKYIITPSVLFAIANKSSISEQKELNRKERIISSIEKYMLLSSDFDKSSKVLIIDDVTTTGSTINSCINLLKSSGFKYVDGLTLYAQI